MTSKEKILQLLVENKDQYISGEYIAKDLGISRNAIWKAMNDLRQSGYIIDAVKNKGYCLSSKNDIISAPDILNYMHNPKAVSLSIHDSLESTNRTAKELAISKVVHGTTIIADQQTGGVAHNSKKFSSPTGGVYMSIILDPDRLSVKDNSIISAFSAVSVCKAIEDVSDITPSIQLVTDIFNGEEKIVGILNESAFDFETEKLQWIVIGIGIPGKIAENRNQLIAAILNNILSDKNSKEEILQYYNKHHH